MTAVTLAHYRKPRHSFRALFVLIGAALLLLTASTFVKSSLTRATASPTRDREKPEALALRHGANFF
ncbi:MAG: hypothetical protein HY804_10545 [Nitrospinae bacterium]|nr:hypothetical protein [Nitrospinota bacterium]